MNILILQKNTGIAGAQNSLRRLLMTEAFKNHNVVVVTGLNGWLVEQTKKLGIPIISVDFPASRSVYGKFVGNYLWLKSVVNALNVLGFIPDIVQANNHVETPFLKLLKSKYRRAISVVLLQDGYIQDSIYHKYQCYECDIKVAVSKTIINVLTQDEKIILINNGVFEHEIYSAPSQKSAFPARWLILGNPNEEKGWFDFLSALSQLFELGLVAKVERIVFTGIPSGESKKRYDIASRKFDDNIELMFVSPFDNLGQACREFDLVIAPSRHESFGMALLEACCSRVCVISSKTGIADKIIFDNGMLFSPGNVDELVDSLKYVIEQWPSISGLCEHGIEEVRNHFSVEQNAQSLIKLYSDNQDRLNFDD